MLKRHTTSTQKSPSRLHYYYDGGSLVMSCVGWKFQLTIALLYTAFYLPFCPSMACDSKKTIKCKRYLICIVCLCNISHGFSWHCASRGPSAIAEFLVFCCVHWRRRSSDVADAAAPNEMDSVGARIPGRINPCSNLTHPFLCFQISENERTIAYVLVWFVTGP